MSYSPEHESDVRVAETSGNAHNGVGVNREVTTNADREPLLSWGAILAGLFVLIAISWLLYLFGTALGVSIVDATDGDAIGTGLGIGAIIWMLISSLIAYFLGSLLAARMSGKTDNTVGMIHGLTLWGLATTLLVVFSYMGVTSLLQTGAGLASSTVSSVASATSSAGAQAVDAGQLSTAGADTELADNIQANLKRRAASAVSQAATEGRGSVEADEVRAAIDTIDSQTMQKVAFRLVQGKTQSAKDVLAANTNLTNRQVNEIVDGVEEDVSSTIQQFQDEASEAAEAASTYVQAVLWSVFSASAMGLAISLLGGYVGTESTRTIEVQRRRQPV